MALQLSSQLTSKAPDLTFLEGHVIDGTKGPANAVLYCVSASPQALQTYRSLM